MKMLYFFADLYIGASEFPAWISQEAVGLADCVDLEPMALPSSDPTAIAIKEEALLTNLQQRFKKDHIYVSQQNIN